MTTLFRRLLELRDEYEKQTLAFQRDMEKLGVKVKVSIEFAIGTEVLKEEYP